MTMSKSAAQTGLDAIVQAVAGCEVVDLTVTLAEQMPANWPTHMPFQRKVYNWYESRSQGQIQPIHGFRGPYHTAWLVLDEHCGTHVDAPAHFVAPPDSGVALSGEMGLQTVEKLDLGKLMGPAAVIDASDLTEQGSNGVCVEITADLVRQWEAEHGELQAGEIVLFSTGWTPGTGRCRTGRATSSTRSSCSKGRAGRRRTYPASSISTRRASSPLGWTASASARPTTACRTINSGWRGECSTSNCWRT